MYINPTISTDMLDSLDDTTGIRGVNSGAGVGLRGKVKKMYWRLFARLYGWVGGKIDVVMCNSSWTQRPYHSAVEEEITPNRHSRLWYILHVLWKCSRTGSMYPLLSESKREHMLLYIAQFRQEKNHTMILNAFAQYYHALPEDERKDAKLVLMGSVRANTPDETHIYKLRLDAREIGD